MNFLDKDCALFVGREQEGPSRGIATIFVVGDVPIAELVNAMQNNSLCNHIYFGAGGTFVFNKETVQDIANNYKEYWLTIESPDYDIHLHRQLLEKHNSPIFWVIPIMWASKPEIKDKHPLSILDRTEFGKTKMDSVLFRMIRLKIDTGFHVLVTEFAHSYWNSIDKGYEGDRVVWAKDRQ